MMEYTSEDVGNIVHLEHVNLQVPDQTLATLFYIVGMGFTRDPFFNIGVHNMWANGGEQQFHLPEMIFRAPVHARVGPGQHASHANTGRQVVLADDAAGLADAHQRAGRCEEGVGKGLRMELRQGIPKRCRDPAPPQRDCWR